MSFKYIYLILHEQNKLVLSDGTSCPNHMQDDMSGVGEDWDIQHGDGVGRIGTESREDWDTM